MAQLKDTDFKLIEDFLSGSLTAKEEEDFKERLQTDSDLTKAYRFRLKIKQYWNEAETYAATKSTIKRVTSIEKKKRNNRFIWSIAASVVVVIGISVLIYPQLDTFKNIPGMADSKQDSVSSGEAPINSYKQPQKGNLHVLPLTFNINDTLTIAREKDFPDIIKVCITKEDNQQVQNYEFQAKADSLVIPLHGIMPGIYEWRISGTKYSGKFRIEANSDIKIK